MPPSIKEKACFSIECRGHRSYASDQFSGEQWSKNMLDETRRCKACIRARAEVMDKPLFGESAPMKQQRLGFGGAAPVAAAALEAATSGNKPSAASPRPARKRAADLAKTPDGMVSGTVEAERAKTRRLLEYAEMLEADLRR